MNKIRVRFAPSNTGFLHSAGLRTALYNYLFAKKMGGEFYVRIEDTDDKRFHEKAYDYIRESLEWCGIVPDDSPWNPNPKYGEYFQSKRDYTYYLNFLVDYGHAYMAFDTPEELASKKIPYTHKNRMSFRNSFSLSTEEVDELIADEIPYTIRLNVPPNKEIILHDLIRGNIKFNTNDIDDKVLIKSNGIPTYHFCHVVDDHLMETSHVIRGEEWIPSAPVHLLLWEMFGWEKPEYIHLSLILNPDGSGKLSKRNAFKKGFEIFPLECSDVDEKGENVTFRGFKGLGYEPIAYLNFIALLGCSFDQDVMNWEELVKQFELNHISTSPSIFDVNKLNHINRTHLLNLSDGEIVKRLIDEEYYTSEQLNVFPLGHLFYLIELSKERMKVFSDLCLTIDIFLYHEKTTDISEHGKVLAQCFRNQLLASIKNPRLEDNYDFEYYKRWVANSNNYADKKELREILCGGKSGPELAAVLTILSKEEIINRINKYL